MTYEEKLNKIVSRLKEERELTRKGRTTKVTFNDASYTKVRIADICKILLILQDDEGALKILDALQPLETVSTEQIISPTDDDDYENVELITVELDEKFDDWYKRYLMKQKTSLENLDYINLLRIYDTVLDINEQLQLRHETSISIPSLPARIRFRLLFPADTIGLRDEYCQNRLSSLEYHKEKGAIRQYAHGRDGWDTIVRIAVVLTEFENFYRKIQDEYKNRNKSDNSNGKQTIVSENSIAWPEDFVWQDKTFVFGQFGKITLTSEDRLLILKTLTDKKGGWATINELKGKKDASYVRSTIKQIEDRLPETAKKHISIISTQDDNSKDKPNVGAYRIQVIL